MFGSRHSVIGIIFLIVFLFLASIAANIYSRDAEQKAKMGENFFWQKTFVAFDAVVPLARGFSNFILAKDTDPKNANNASSSVINLPEGISEEEAIANVKESGKDLATRIKEEWARSELEETDISGASTTATGTEIIAGDSLSDFLIWQKNATGAEIVWRSKNGQEHKLPLPFKFLSGLPK